MIQCLKGICIHIALKVNLPGFPKDPPNLDIVATGFFILLHEETARKRRISGDLHEVLSDSQLSLSFL